MSEVDDITFHLEDETQATHHANLYRSSPQQQLYTVTSKSQTSSHKDIIPSTHTVTIPAHIHTITSISSTYKDTIIPPSTPLHTITSPPPSTCKDTIISSPSDCDTQQKLQHDISSPSSHPISPPTHSRTLSSHRHSYEAKYSSSPPKHIRSIPVLTSRAPDFTIISTSTSTSTKLPSRSIHIAQLESTTNLADSLRQQVESHQQAIRDMELWMDDSGKVKKKLSGPPHGLIKAKTDGSLSNSNSSQTGTLLTAGSLSSTPSPSQAVRTIRNETNSQPITSPSTPIEATSIPEKSRCHCICM